MTFVANYSFKGHVGHYSGESQVKVVITFSSNY